MVVGELVGVTMTRDVEVRIGSLVVDIEGMPVVMGGVGVNGGGMGDVGDVVVPEGVDALVVVDVSVVEEEFVEEDDEVGDEEEVVDVEEVVEVVEEEIEVVVDEVEVVVVVVVVEEESVVVVAAVGMMSGTVKGRVRWRKRR